MNTTDYEKKPALDAAWVDLVACFGIGEDRKADPDRALSHATAVALAKYGIAERTARFVQSEVVERRLREDVTPSFWAFFVDASRESEEERCARFASAIDFLVNAYTDIGVLVDRMDGLGVPCNAYGQTTYRGLFNLTLKGTLHSQLPGNFEVVVEVFYARAFHVFCVRQEKDRTIVDDDFEESEDDGQLECSGCRREKDSCVCAGLLAQFREVNAALIAMDLLDRLTSACVTRIVHARIERHVADTCKGNFTVSHLARLEEWLDAVVMGFIRNLYSDPAGTHAVLHSFRRRLGNHLYETYTRARIEQLFNVIIEFPDSSPALEDLRECLQKTDLRQYLTASLRSVLQKKLLHLGVSTTDILTAYISAIKSLRVLDPSGVILQIVCEPVRRYLRTRDDTVRCIVQSLIDDGSSELSEELTKGQGICLEESFEDEEDKMADGWDNWMPDPVDADPAKTSASRRAADIISMLVNIYGSKELFVNEYRSLLSNRLLSHFSYDTDKEIRNLELLKLRFGDAPLHQCEVMLKDIGDSKRINTNLHSFKIEDSAAAAPAAPTESDIPNDENAPTNATANEANKELSEQPFPVNAIVLSAQFWDGSIR